MARAINSRGGCPKTGCGKNGASRAQDGNEGIIGRHIGPDGDSIDPEQLQKRSGCQAGVRVPKGETDQRTGDNGPGYHELDDHPVQADQCTQYCRDGCLAYHDRPRGQRRSTGRMPANAICSQPCPPPRRSRKSTTLSLGTDLSSTPTPESIRNRMWSMSSSARHTDVEHCSLQFSL